MKCIKKLAVVFAAALVGVSAWAQDKLSDYLEQIYDLNYQRAMIQDEYETAFQEANAQLNAEMQKEFARISEMEQYGWESADEYNTRVTEEIEAVSAKRKEAIARTDSEIRSKFDAQLTAIDRKKQALIDELTEKEFVYSGDSLNLSFSAFNRTEKFFPFTVKSNENDLNYTSRGLHYSLNRDRLAEEWPVFDGYIKQNALSAQVNFVVEKNVDTSSYQKKVTQVKLVDGNGTVIATYDVNESVEIVSMDEAIEAANKTSVTVVDAKVETVVADVAEDEIAETEEAATEFDEEIEEPEEE